MFLMIVFFSLSYSLLWYIFWSCLLLASCGDTNFFLVLSRAYRGHRRISVHMNPFSSREYADESYAPTNPVSPFFPFGYCGAGTWFGSFYPSFCLAQLVFFLFLLWTTKEGSSTRAGHKSGRHGGRKKGQEKEKRRRLFWTVGQAWMRREGWMDGWMAVWCGVG